MSKVYLTENNCRALFSQAYNLLLDVESYYPVIMPSFYSISDTIAEYKKLAKPNEQFQEQYLVDTFKVKKLSDDDRANRQIIYTLTDSYFLACVWYNLFSYVTGYNDNFFREKLGTANDTLADFTKDTIRNYELGSDMNKIDKRSITTGIGMSWVAYESKVLSSLSYTKQDLAETYHNIVNAALADKLGLNEVYQPRRKAIIDGVHKTDKS